MAGQSMFPELIERVRSDGLIAVSCDRACARFGTHEMPRRVAGMAPVSASTRDAWAESLQQHRWRWTDTDPVTL